MAVWNALAGGARVVSIGGEPGAGATTLLHVLAAGARDHGFANGAVLASAARGPAADVAQRLAELFDRSERGGSLAAAELARVADPPSSLICLDDARLSDTHITELGEMFPNAAWVVVNAFALAGAATVNLGPLNADNALRLLAASYERPIDADNRRAALDFCASVGSLPGPIRLIGIAARRMRRSFISLQLEHDSGDAILAAFIASLPAAHGRILAIMALARVPLAAHHVAYVTRNGGVAACLEQLGACELVHACGPQTYELPAWVENLVVRPADARSVVARIADVLCDCLNSEAAVPVLDCQIAAAEQFLQYAAEVFPGPHVLALGSSLARLLAARGAFGARSRVLGIVEAAAARAGDAAPLEGTAAAVFAESSAKAAASETREPAITAPRLGRSGLLLLFLGLGIVTAALVALSFSHRPTPAPAIVRFWASPVSISGGGSAELCVDAVDAAVVEIFPDAKRVPGAGKPCLTVHPRATTLYVAVGSGLDGQQVRSALTLTVRDAGAPRPVNIAGFSARPARIRPGQSTRLCYAVSGARLLRIFPRIGSLVRLEACRTITLREPRRYTYLLFAQGENGQIAVRSAHVDVVKSKLPVNADPRSGRAEQLTRRAIYQFDATPSVLERGQAASLCAGVERPARGFLTHVGRLPPGITRCYRVAPDTTTVYRLYVAERAASAVRTVTVAVRPSARAGYVAGTDRR